MTIDMRKEVWADIADFPYYQISNLGRIYNVKFDRMMSVSMNNHGHMKISLLSDWSGIRHTKTVATLVAEAFVPKPNELCDHVIVLDGDFTNMVAHNLAWRPWGFARMYTRQLKVPQPRHYENLPVLNVSKGILYRSVTDAGMSEGLLFRDVWRATYSRQPVFPTGDHFEIPREE